MFRSASNIGDLYQLNDSMYHARTSGAEKCRRQVRCCEFTSKVRGALKEEPSNSMVDFVMQMAKIVIVKSATNGSERRDG